MPCWSMFQPAGAVCCFGSAGPRRDGQNQLWTSPVAALAHRLPDRGGVQPGQLRNHITTAACRRGGSSPTWGGWHAGMGLGQGQHLPSSLGAETRFCPCCQSRVSCHTRHWREFGQPPLRDIFPVPHGNCRELAYAKRNLPSYLTQAKVSAVRTPFSTSDLSQTLHSVSPKWSQPHTPTTHNTPDWDSSQHLTSSTFPIFSISPTPPLGRRC